MQSNLNLVNSNVLYTVESSKKYKELTITEERVIEKNKT